MTEKRNMEMEEIKSIPVYEDYVDLHRDFPYEERSKYLPAHFDGKELLSRESLCNVFDGDCCLTLDDDGNMNALGFIADIPTRAVAENNKIVITSMATPLDKLFDEWKDAIMENFFGFEPGDVELETTIYDTSGFLVWCYSIGADTIVLEFFHNLKHEG